MFDKTQIVPKREDCQTFFESSFMSIKSDLCDIANTYLHIAFKVYEIDARIRRDGKKCKYKNIVEACETELGFKKSTTYNMLNIVKTYWIDSDGNITYKQLITFNTYSYSQLVEMLSLGASERSEVSPDTSVNEIRRIKKRSKTETEIFQTSGKTAYPSDVVHTSGKVVEVCESPSCQFYILPSVEYISEDLLTYADGSSWLKIVRENGELIIEVNQSFFDLVDSLADFFGDLCDDLAPYASSSRRYLRSYDIERYSSSDVFEKFSAFYPIFARVLNSYSKLEK